MVNKVSIMVSKKKIAIGGCVIGCLGHYRFRHEKVIENGNLSR
jgi:hypothetical protein